MFKHKLDLMIKILTLPYSEFEFYTEDFFEQLAQKKNSQEYKEYIKYYEDIFLSCVYKIIHRTQVIHNLDQIKLLIEMFYPDDELLNNFQEHNNVYHYYLQKIMKLAKAFITQRDGKVVIKYWEGTNEDDFLGPYKGLNKIALWNSLSRMFTTDMLVLAYLIYQELEDEEYLNGFYSQVALEDLQLEQVLKKGVAETHLHAKAAINFSIRWQDLMNITIKNKKLYEKRAFSNSVIDKNFGLEHYVKVMAFARLVMADYLENFSHASDFYNGYVNKRYSQYFQCQDGSDTNANEDSGSLDCELAEYKIYEFIHDILYDIYEGTKIDEFKHAYELKYHFVELFDELKSRFNFYEDELIKTKHDILAECVFESYVHLDTSMENVLIFKALKYIKHNPKDKFFGKIFWQYVRIKNEFFQCNVQGNLIKGLDNFKGYYNRSTEISFDSEAMHWHVIFKNQLQNTNLKKLELRIAPRYDISKERIKHKMKKTLQAIFHAYENLLLEEYEGYKKALKEISPDRLDDVLDDKIYAMQSNLPSIGIVYHFIKRPDDRGKEKCWYGFDGANYGELYFAEIRNEYKKLAEVINELRETIPFLSEYIVGLDAANLENSTEPWVFAPVYRDVRSSKANMPFSIGTNRYRIKTLGFTFHAGEDYRHILTGLRRIDEVIEHFYFRAGDRIGHGIALGLDVTKWIESNRIVTLPRIEYLENLLWLWGLYKDGKHLKGFDMEYLEKEIMGQAEFIYKKIDGITVYNLWKAYNNKFEDFEISEKFKNKYKSKKRSGHSSKENIELFCINASSGETRAWSEEKLKYVQHCKCYLERMDKPILVEVRNQDSEMLKQIQKIILSKISNGGIIIETNPTSNTAIGEIESIFEHYIHNLNNKGLNGDSNNEKAVIITINSDDPSVFNTNVSSEIAYIFYSLLEKGYPRENIISWIDKVREYGMMSSFIDDRNLTIGERLREVAYIIKELEQ